MTTVERCRECGKLFSFLPRGICRDCLEEREHAFTRVRDWFRENPGQTVGAAADATGVAVQVIGGWIAEGRLQGHRVVVSPTEEEAREAARLEEIRRALAETVATDPPPAAAPAAPERATPRHGMHWRHH